MEERIEENENFVIGGRVRLKTGQEFEDKCHVGFDEAMWEVAGQEVTIRYISSDKNAFLIEGDGLYYSYSQIDFRTDGNEPEVEEEEKEKIDFAQGYTPTDEEIDEMISKVDIDTFNKVIKNRIYNDIPSHRLEELKQINRAWARKFLRRWAESKFKFYKILGNQLSIEQEVEVERDDAYFNNKRDDLAMKFPIYYKVIKSISTVCYRNNELIPGAYPFEYAGDARVKDHMKLTGFISLFGNNELDSELSKLYQCKGIAKIHISIDPIDYLTVSINNSGWRSCHNFFDGEWRNAGLSLLFDKTSLVSYVSDKKVHYPQRYEFDWNSKSWRQMIYMSEHSSSIVFSRQYPFDSDSYIKAVRSMFEEKVSNFFGAENKWKLYGHVDRANVEVYKDEDWSTLYNDVAEGFGHKVVRNKQDINIGDFDSILIGSDIYKLNDESERLGEHESIW